jgi:hypothetical protein
LVTNDRHQHGGGRCFEHQRQRYEIIDIDAAVALFDPA